MAQKSTESIFEPWRCTNVKLYNRFPITKATPLPGNHSQGMHYLPDLALLDRLVDKGVADTWNSQYIGWFTRIRFNFLAKVPYVGLDQRCIPIIIETPDIGDNLIRSADIVRVNSKQMQQLAFNWSQASRFFIDS